MRLRYLRCLSHRGPRAPTPEAGDPPDQFSDHRPVRARPLPLLKAQHPLSLSLATAGSETAINDVIGGYADAALISRPLTDDEARSLHATTIAVDALLLVANERNPLTTLDEQTVRSTSSGARSRTGPS